MKTQTLRFVLDVSSAAGDLIDRPEGYDCFVVEIDPTYARRLMTLIRTVHTLERRFPGLYKLELWDGHGDYYAVDYAAETLPAGMSQYGNAKDQRFVPTGEPSRTECTRLMVMDDGVHWAAYPKHSDLEVETETLPLSELLTIARPPQPGP